MTFDPTTNRIQWQHLTEEEMETLRTWKHGWEYWSDLSEEWVPQDKPSTWYDDTVYRAKPAPEVKSTWHKVFKDIEGNPYALESHPSRESANVNRTPNRIGVIRLDLIDGKLSAEVEE